MQDYFFAILMSCILFVIQPVPMVIGDTGIYIEQQNLASRDEIICINELYPDFSINTFKVRVEVMYKVGTVPPKTFYYSKEKSGVKYAGNLSIESIRYREDAVYAVYSGYLDPI
jgi:hypothetical protein